MPVIRPRGSSGYLEMNINPRVAITGPIGRMDGPQDRSDGWRIELNDLTPDAAERTVYAPVRGWVVYARQSDRSRVRAFMMFDPAAREEIAGRWRRRPAGLLGGFAKEFDCLEYIELQELEHAGTRATLHAYISAAQALGTTLPNSTWTLDTDVATAAPQPSGTPAPSKLGAWLGGHSVDDYISQFLYADTTLDGLSEAMAAGRRPDAFGLRVNAGDPIGVASTGMTAGATRNYVVFLKMWNQDLRAMNPGFFLRAVLANVDEFRIVGDTDLSPTNRLGLSVLQALSWNPAVLIPPDTASQTAIHPLLWHLSLDEHGNDYTVFRRNPSTNRVALVETPSRFVPEAASRSYTDLAAVHASERFANVVDVDGFFSRISGGTHNGFIPWFRAKQGHAAAWLNHNPKRACCGGAASRLIVPRNHQDGRPTQEAFARVWNNIPAMFGTPDINFVQVITQLTMMIRETGGSFRPLSERGGIRYMFQYNRRPINWSCRRLFSDPLFLFAHRHLLPADSNLPNSTAAIWNGSTYPAGYSQDTAQQPISFIAEADFFKFRGRGFIQTTGRSNYRKLANYVLAYAGTNSIVSGVKTRWDVQLAAAGALGVEVGAPGSTDRVDAALTISTLEDWRLLFEETDYTFAANALRVFYLDSHGNQRLNYRSTDQPMDYVRRLSDAVSGAACSVEVNTMRVHSVLRSIVDG